MTSTTGAMQPGAHGTPGAIAEHPVFVQHKHPSYVLIFVILFIFTILEVWVTTPLAGIEFPLPVIKVPTLLILAILKFATIVGYYMHLRFDSRAYSALFIVGLLLAIGMLFTLQALFTAHHRLPFDATAAREAGQLGEKATGTTTSATGATTTSGTGAGTAGAATTGTATSGTPATGSTTR